MPDAPTTEPPEPAPPASPDAAQGRAARRTNRAEILLAVLLGIAALLTALSSYIADRDDGRQLTYLQASGRTQSAANDAYSAGDQQKSLDQTIFVEFATAYDDGETKLAGYLATLSPTLRAALNAWTKNDKAETPFAGDPPIYQPPQYAEGDALGDKADREFARADHYDKRGDEFVLATVVFAAALGLLGIASVVRRNRLKAGIGACGTAALLGGIAIMAVNL